MSDLFLGVAATALIGGLYMYSQKEEEKEKILPVTHPAYQKPDPVVHVWTPKADVTSYPIREPTVADVKYYATALKTVVHPKQTSNPTVVIPKHGKPVISNNAVVATAGKIKHFFSSIF